MRVDARRRVAVLLPAVVPAQMAAVFAVASRRYGSAVGYRLGFLSYWATCAGLSVGVLGPRELARRLTRGGGPLPRPRALAAAALLLPPAGAVAVELVPHLRRAGSATVVTAALVGACNGVCEELLWRAVPAALYPDDPIRGWLWPAAGFTAWHAVPLAIRSHGRGRVLTGAALIGLGSGWVAWSTGSIAATTPAHVLTDACGVRAARSTWGLAEHGSSKR